MKFETFCFLSMMICRVVVGAVENDGHGGKRSSHNNNPSASSSGFSRCGNDGSYGSESEKARSLDRSVRSTSGATDEEVGQIISSFRQRALDLAKKPHGAPSPLLQPLFESLCEEVESFKKDRADQLKYAGPVDANGEPLIEQTYPLDDLVRSLLVHVASQHNLPTDKIPSPLGTDQVRPETSRRSSRAPRVYRLPRNGKIDFSNLAGLVSVSVVAETDSDKSNSDEK